MYDNFFYHIWSMLIMAFIMIPTDDTQYVFWAGECLICASPSWRKMKMGGMVGVGSGEAILLNVERRFFAPSICICERGNTITITIMGKVWNTLSAFNVDYNFASDSGLCQGRDAYMCASGGERRSWYQAAAFFWKSRPARSFGYYYKIDMQ